MSHLTLEDLGIVLVPKKKRVVIATLYYGELLSVSLRTSRPHHAVEQLTKIIHAAINREGEAPND